MRKKSILLIIILVLIIVIGLFFYFSMNKESTFDSSRCYLEPDGGTCKALFKRYYFDLTEGICKPFNYGGCNGVVPFENLEECKNACE